MNEVYVSLFNISKHICISALFFLISVHALCFFSGVLKIIAPGGGALALFSAPGVGGSHFPCARGMGNSPFQKIPRGLAPGDGQAWN